ncbi:Argininosuccinate Lyase [Manis pentadactyla]|nr:Argininosuccinate Lyase [Manis pentadactyla]
MQKRAHSSDAQAGGSAHPPGQPDAVTQPSLPADPTRSHWPFLEKHKLGQRATQMKEWQRQKCSSLSGFQRPIDLVPSLAKEAKI